MCRTIWDVTSNTICETPRDLAALIGRDNIVWSSAYEGRPSAEDLAWMDACLCPVDLVETLAKVGAELLPPPEHGMHTEIRMPLPSPPTDGAAK